MKEGGGKRMRRQKKGTTGRNERAKGFNEYVKKGRRNDRGRKGRRKEKKEGGSNI